MDGVEESEYARRIEADLLGTMFKHKSAATHAVERVNGGDFYHPEHEIVFDAIKAVGPNPGIVTDYLMKRNLFRNLPAGHTFVWELSKRGHPTPEDGYDLAAMVTGAALRRRGVTTAAKIVTLFQNKEPQDALEEAQQLLDKLDIHQDTTVRTLEDVAVDAVNELHEEVKQVLTPWPSVNELIGGLRPGGVYVVGARPSVGKSVCALQLARELARFGPVPFFSLEMTRNQMFYRLAASELRIDINRLLQHNLTNADKQKLTQAAESGLWRGIPIMLNQDARDMPSIKAFIREVRHTTGLAGVVVDYLQLMSHAGHEKPENFQRFVAECSNQFKRLAMELEIPVVLLSQLNRSSESRGDGMPKISDLRESGAIEQDADVVMLMHRELMGETKNDLTMLIGKNRSGTTGSVELQFWGHYAAIKEGFAADPVSQPYKD